VTKFKTKCWEGRNASNGSRGSRGVSVFGGATIKSKYMKKGSVIEEEPLLCDMFGRFVAYKGSFVMKESMAAAYLRYW
jgi:hypothetical protein